MLDFEALLTRLQATPLAEDSVPLVDVTRSICAGIRHGDLPRWQAAVDALPSVDNIVAELSQDCVSVHTAEPLPMQQHSQLRESLLALRPWRKGPFSICGITIDTEWRSDWKWQRLCDHLTPLSGRRVLDVGCGSGYHVWRMAGAGADVVIGIDPGLLFNMQFNVLQHFIQNPAVAVLPLKLEQLPQLRCFDTVFSMGVLYHRRDPAEHLLQLKHAMADGAELVLETLVIPAGDKDTLQPDDRYARMRNVWQIPTTETLRRWLEKAGFSDIRLVSDTFTSTDEQRTTEWMPLESLAESLDPNDPHRTIEGYPAPRRVVIFAHYSAPNSLSNRFL